MMPGIDHFGLLAPYYDRLFHAPQDVDWSDLLKISANQRILDVGGGTGRVAQSITRNHQDVVILDASLQMLSIAKLKNRIFPACGMSERLPFQNQSFDRILMVDAFHHLDQQEVSCQELWRILKPGGRLVIEEPDIRQFRVKLIAIGEKLLFMRSHFWAAEQIAKIFQVNPCRINISRQNGSAWIIIDRES